MLLLFFQDFSRRYQMGFQDTATPIMSAILDLHAYVCVFLIVIFVIVSFQIYDVLRFFRIDYHYKLKPYVWIRS